ncbi:Cyclic nucleotide-gated cation channel subunit A [Diplonema papillatum]|nr:Cyclic nucleotide-gated cation channel subunit A [Diplonema papillatum]
MRDTPELLAEVSKLSHEASELEMNLDLALMLGSLAHNPLLPLSDAPSVVAAGHSMLNSSCIEKEASSGRCRGPAANDEVMSQFRVSSGRKLSVTDPLSCTITRPKYITREYAVKPPIPVVDMLPVLKPGPPDNDERQASFEPTSLAPAESLGLLNNNLLPATHRPSPAPSARNSVVTLSKCSRAPSGVSRQLEPLELRALWDTLAGGRSFLSYDEVKKLLACIGVTLRDWKMMEFFTLVDEDRNGEISYEEFAKGFNEFRRTGQFCTIWSAVRLACYLSVSRGITTEQVVRLWQRYDDTGAEVLDSASLRLLLRDLGLQFSVAEVEEAVHELDFDKNGTLSFHAFLSMFADAPVVNVTEKRLDVWVGEVRKVLAARKIKANGYQTADQQMKDSSHARLIWYEAKFSRCLFLFSQLQLCLPLFVLCFLNAKIDPYIESVVITSDLIWYWWIYTNFHLPKEVGGVFIYDKRKTARFYFCSRRFALDFVIALPLDLLVWFVDPSLFLHPALRMNKLLLLFYNNELFFKVFAEILGPIWWRIVNALHWWALLAHLVACCFEPIAAGAGDENTRIVLTVAGYSELDITLRYLQAFSYSVNTMAGLSRGAFPSDDAQAMYALFVVVIGVFVYALLLAVVAFALSVQTQNARFQTMIDEVKDVIGSEVAAGRLPGHFLQESLAYHKHVFHSTGQLQIEEDLLCDLPAELQVDVSLIVGKRTIARVPIFSDAVIDDEFVYALQQCLQLVVAPPGFDIIEKHAEGREMYFIMCGCCDVLNDADEVVHVLRQGDMFGEISLVASVPRTATIRTATFCNLLELKRDDFDLVMSAFPGLHAKIEAKANDRIRDIRLRQSITLAKQKALRATLSGNPPCDGSRGQGDFSLSGIPGSCTPEEAVPPASPVGDQENPVAWIQRTSVRDSNRRSGESCGRKGAPSATSCPAAQKLQQEPSGGGGAVADAGAGARCRGLAARNAAAGAVRGCLEQSALEGGGPLSFACSETEPSDPADVSKAEDGEKGVKLRDALKGSEPPSVGCEGSLPDASQAGTGEKSNTARSGRNDPSAEAFRGYSEDGTLRGSGAPSAGCEESLPGASQAGNGARSGRDDSSAAAGWTRSYSEDDTSEGSEPPSAGRERDPPAPPHASKANNGEKLRSDPSEAGGGVRSYPKHGVSDGSEPPATGRERDPPAPPDASKADAGGKTREPRRLSRRPDPLVEAPSPAKGTEREPTDPPDPLLAAAAAAVAAAARGGAEKVPTGLEGVSFSREDRRETSQSRSDPPEDFPHSSHDAAAAAAASGGEEKAPKQMGLENVSSRNDRCETSASPSDPPEAAKPAEEGSGKAERHEPEDPSHIPHDAPAAAAAASAGGGEKVPRGQESVSSRKDRCETSESLSDPPDAANPAEEGSGKAKSHAPEDPAHISHGAPAASAAASGGEEAPRQLESSSRDYRREPSASLSDPPDAANPAEEGSGKAKSHAPEDRAHISHGAPAASAAAGGEEAPRQLESSSRDYRREPSASLSDPPDSAARHRAPIDRGGGADAGPGDSCGGGSSAGRNPPSARSGCLRHSSGPLADGGESRVIDVSASLTSEASLPSNPHTTGRRLTVHFNEASLVHNANSSCASLPTFEEATTSDMDEDDGFPSIPGSSRRRSSEFELEGDSPA